jgi:MOSC domain-containing protein YiiM
MSLPALIEGLEVVRRSPRVAGTLEMIVCRPGEDERNVVEAAGLDTVAGLVGDNWATRPNPSLDAQVTLMNARAADLIAESRDRWSLAGDQLFVDFDLAVDTLPPGAMVRIGAAVVEISALPHTGCQKFSQRFGVDALRFVNSEEGKALRLRGVNARVARAGMVRLGDVITVL